MQTDANFAGVEIKYDLYNPSILKIETLKLERRLDDDLSYLRDALPEYSTFDFDMEPVPHAVGTPVPINPIKVRHRPSFHNRTRFIYLSLCAHVSLFYIIRARSPSLPPSSRRSVVE